MSCVKPALSMAHHRRGSAAGRPQNGWTSPRITVHIMRNAPRRRGAFRVSLGVPPTDVVDVREETLHRGLPSELAVGTAVIVRMDEVREGDRPSAVAGVRAGIG